MVFFFELPLMAAKVHYTVHILDIYSVIINKVLYHKQIYK